MVAEVTNEAMLVFGGYGYSKEFPIERMHRDALAWRVAGGTVQMLRITLASILSPGVSIRSRELKKHGRRRRAGFRREKHEPWRDGQGSLGRFDRRDDDRRNNRR
jgi:hypothetical protein